MTFAILLALTFGMSAGQSSAATSCMGVASCSSLHEYVAWAKYASADSVWLDLRYIASADDVHAWFNATLPEARAHFLNSFWGVRAARSAVTAEERYVEHRRRLEKTRRWYGKSSSRRMIGAAGSAEWYEGVAPILIPPARSADMYRVDLDDRGLVFMRFGEPSRVFSCVANSKKIVEKFVGTTYNLSERGEIWVYPPTILDGPRVVMFATRGRANVYQLVFTPGQTECETRYVTDLIRSMAPVTSDFIHAASEDLLSARGFIGAVSLATRLGNLGPEALMNDVAVLDAKLAAQVAAAASESAAPSYASHLSAAYEMLYFRDLSTPDSKLTEVHLTIASPAAELESIAGSEYRYRARLSLIDTSNAIIDVDSSHVYRPARGLPAEAAIEHGLLVAIDPGAYSYALRLEGGDAVGGAAIEAADAPTANPVRPGHGSSVTGRAHVPALEPDGNLRLSSIAIGRPNLLGSWARLGESMDLLPTHTVPADGKVAFYYEVYGAAPGESLTTTLVLTRRGGMIGGDDLMQLRFDDVGGETFGVTPAMREIDLRSLAKGDYDVVLSVSSASLAPATVETLLRWH